MCGLNRNNPEHFFYQCSRDTPGQRSVKSSSQIVSSITRTNFMKKSYQLLFEHLLEEFDVSTL